MKGSDYFYTLPRAGLGFKKGLKSDEPKTPPKEEGENDDFVFIDPYIFS